MAVQMDKPDALGRQVVDAAFKVHKELGPGLLESVYEHCLAYELGKRGIPVPLLPNSATGWCAIRKKLNTKITKGTKMAV